MEKIKSPSFIDYTYKEWSFWLIVILWSFWSGWEAFVNIYIGEFVGTFIFVILIVSLFYFLSYLLTRSAFKKINKI